MAIRQLRYDGDPLLRKRSREVNEITDKIIVLLDDMKDTMYKEEGIGLAAPQIGILKRIFVIDIGEGIIEFINPEIIEEDGEQIDFEGCLSIPGKSGKVKRPQTVKVKYLDRDGSKKTLEARELLARAICHELDHLNGVLFTDKTID